MWLKHFCACLPSADVVSMELHLPQDPVQLRALLFKVLGGSRGRAAARQAEFEGLGLRTQPSLRLKSSNARKAPPPYSS